MTVILRDELSTAFGRYGDIVNLDAVKTAEFYSNLSYDVLSSQDHQAKVVLLHTLRRFYSYAVGIGAHFWISW